MKLCNQLEYAHVAYPTTLSPEDCLKKPYPSVAQAGCGICCICMLLEQLCGVNLTVEEGVALSVQAGANHNGTDMKRMGNAAAERYHLNMTSTDQMDAILQCLSSGGAAILNVGGSTQERIGSFSDQGHFVFATGYVEPYVHILDPSYRAEKYQRSQRAARVIPQENGALGITPQDLAADLKLRSPGAYLFCIKDS